MPKDKSPLPNPTVSFRLGGSKEPFTEEEVRGILANPTNAGMGPFPQIVTDEQCVRAAAKAIETDGTEQFLVNLLSMLRHSLATIELD